jgi:hypothetical protein
MPFFAVTMITTGRSGGYANLIKPETRLSNNPRRFGPTVQIPDHLICFGVDKKCQQQEDQQDNEFFHNHAHPFVNDGTHSPTVSGLEDWDDEPVVLETNMHQVGQKGNDGGH